MQEKLAVTFLVTMLALFGLVVVLYQMIEENNEDYTQIVLRQHSSYDSRTLPYRRGDIVDRNGTYLATSEMVYNPEAGQYEKALLLKQGNYNYQYIYLPDGQEEGVTAAIEGDFHQTENEYTIYVYYRPIGARFDRLVGVRTVRSGQEAR